MSGAVVIFTLRAILIDMDIAKDTGFPPRLKIIPGQAAGMTIGRGAEGKWITR